MDERRQSERVEIEQSTTFEVAGESFTATIKDVSFGGTLLVSGHRPKLGASIVLADPRLGRVSGSVIRHTDDGFAVALEQDADSAVYALKSITLDKIDNE